MPISPSWDFTITLAPKAENIAIARRFVTEHLTSHRLATLVDDVALVTSELATNAYAHAATPFTVTLAAYLDAVVVTVEDGSLLPPAQVHAGALESGGRGLAIVDQLSRDWGVTLDPKTGKAVWATFSAG